MGGGASIIAPSKYKVDQSQDIDYEQQDEADDDDDEKTIWENGLLDLGSKTLSDNEFEQSMSDSETVVGQRRITRRRPRSSTWSHPIPEEPPRSIRRSLMCCTGNSVAFQVAVNFKPHISDLADVGGG